MAREGRVADGMTLSLSLSSPFRLPLSLSVSPALTGAGEGRRGKGESYYIRVGEGGEETHAGELVVAVASLPPPAAARGRTSVEAAAGPGG